MKKTFILIFGLLHVLGCFAGKSDSLKSKYLKDAQSSVRDSGFVDLANATAWEIRSLDPDRSIEITLNALSIARNLKYSKGEAKALKNLGSFYTGIGKFSEALDFTNRSLKINLELKDLKAQASDYIGLGIIYKRLGDFPRSLSYYLKALKASETIHDDRGIAATFNNMGLLFESQKKYDEAKNYFLKAKTLFKKVNDHLALSASYNNLGNIYQEQQKFDSALFYYNLSLDIKSSINDKRGMAKCLSNIGNTYQEMSQLDLALNWYHKASSFHHEAGDFNGLVDAQLNMGSVYGKQNKLDKAIGILLDAYHQAKKSRYREGLSFASIQLATWYGEKKDFEKAFMYLNIHNTLKDSIFNHQTSGQLAEMQARFDTEKKTAKIELLTKEKAIQDLELVKQQTELNRQTIIRNSFIGGFILILLLSFLLYNRYIIKQKANLELASRNFEITFQKTEIEKQKEIVEMKSDLLEEKNKDITNSILYARRIQDAILPDKMEFDHVFKDHFIFYQPRDIVSGDFYWFNDNLKINDSPSGNLTKDYLFAVADCTGHGVPGAFMSMIGHTLLNEIVVEKKILEPGQILTQLNLNIKNALKQGKQDGLSRDGMDISICRITEENNELTLTYSSALRPALLFKNDVMTVLTPNKNPIGGLLMDEEKSFISRQFLVNKSDSIYLFTDGYADQFGGEKGKKLMSRKFYEILDFINTLPMVEQEAVLREKFHSWKGELEQVDDVLIWGVRI